MSPHVPELSSLELLTTVAHTGSLGATGRELGLTQQAVSARIRTVERLIGVALLHRGPRGSRLTDAGRLVVDWAAPVLHAAAALDAGIDSLRERRDDHLTIAASYTVAEYLLPGWLVALSTEQAAAGLPRTAVHLAVHNSEQVVTEVLDGRTELGFVEGPDLPAGLAHRVVARDELVVVVPPGHPWTRRPPGPRDLAATPLVAREAGSGTRRAYERAVAPATPAPPAVELSSTSAIRGAVLAGAGPAVLSDLAVHDDLATGRLVAVPVPGLALDRTLSAVWPDGSTPTGPARDLLRIATHGR
nr:LysR family transcriptional regulator [Pseudonocardia petroleophila]